jgi:hypothetical protein
MAEAWPTMSQLIWCMDLRRMYSNIRLLLETYRFLHTQTALLKSVRLQAHRGWDFNLIVLQLSNPVMIKRRRETNAVPDKVKDSNVSFFCRVTIFISTAPHIAAESNLKDPHSHLLTKSPS